MKGWESLKSLAKLGKEQTERESELLSQLMGEAGELSTAENNMTQQRSELLFKLAVEVEDTENTLRRAEQLVLKLKKHLKQLTELQKMLSK